MRIYTTTYVKGREWGRAGQLTLDIQRDDIEEITKAIRKATKKKVLSVTKNKSFGVKSAGAFSVFEYSAELFRS